MNLFLRKRMALAAGAVSIMVLCVLSSIGAIAGGAGGGGVAGGGGGTEASLSYDPFAGDVVGETSSSIIDFVVSLLFRSLEIAKAATRPPTASGTPSAETIYKSAAAVTDLAVVLLDMSSRDIKIIEDYLLPMIVTEGQSLDRVAEKEAELYLNIKNDPIKMYGGLSTIEQYKMKIRAVALKNGIDIE